MERDRASHTGHGVCVTVKGLKPIGRFSYGDGSHGKGKIIIIMIKESMKDKENNQILINSFRGKYFFLSNFYPCQVKYDGITYKNSEAAFQAQKVLDKKERQQFADLEPLDAKKLGKKVSLRGDWEKVKVEIMYSVVKAKFEQNSYLSRQLIDTNDAKLVEGNSYHDIFWGIDMDSGIGENYLGRILMKVREMVLKVNLYKFQLLWQSSIGDANDMLSGNHKAPNINKEPATENSWKIKKTSPKYKINLHELISVSGERMRFLQLGHIPQEMEDHWFMYCDNNSINYFRSWSGDWFFSAKYRELEDGFEIYELYSYNEDDNSSMASLFMYLILSDCGEFEMADIMFDDFINRKVEVMLAKSIYNKFFDKE